MGVASLGAHVVFWDSSTQISVSCVQQGLTAGDSTGRCAEKVRRGTFHGDIMYVYNRRTRKGQLPRQVLLLFTVLKRQQTAAICVDLTTN